MGSIPASPYARNVTLLLCQERFNEASLPVENGNIYQHKNGLEGVLLHRCLFAHKLSYVHALSHAHTLSYVAWKL